MKRSHMPSVGFIWLVIVLMSGVFFFYYANRQSPLEQVWDLSLKLKIGIVSTLTKQQKETFYDVLTRHKKLKKEVASKKGIDLLSCNVDGQMCSNTGLMLRTSDSKAIKMFVLEINSSLQTLPYVVKIKGSDWTKKIWVSKRGKHVVEIPKFTQMEFIDLKVQGKKIKSDDLMPGVKVSIVK